MGVVEASLMEEANAANIIRWYISLEEQLVNFLRIVPPHGQNMKTWSPQLASLIVDACSIIDSLFRYTTKDKVVVNGEEKQRDQLEMPDYQELYSPNLELGQRKVILLISPPEYRTPFKVWLKHKKDKYSFIPQWWTVNNRLKHARIKNFNGATLNAAIDTLSGSLAVIACITKLIPELWPAMVRQGWVNLGGWVPDYIIETLTKGKDLGITLETSLFALYLGNYPLPEDVKEFRPHHYGGSPRLSAFFGKL